MCHKTLRKLLLWAGIIVFCIVFAFADSTKAQVDWLEKGADFLKKLEEKTAEESISSQEIRTGLKEALRIESENVVSKLGSVDGFNGDSVIHIPLPKELNTVKTILAKAGLSSLLDDLELKLNRAAEAAMPKAQELFWQA